MKLPVLSQTLLYSASALCFAVLAGCDASSGVQDGIVNSPESDSPDPVVVDLPIVYVQRPIPRDEDGMIVNDDVLDPAAFNPGAELVLKARAQAAAPETILTTGVFPSANADDPAPLYDVKDLSISRDGTKVLFSMRAPEIDGADEDEQPTWNIWEYDSTTQGLRRIIESDTVAEQGHDVDPAYVSDGATVDVIVFSSTRQSRSKSILLDENKPQFDPGIEDDRDEPTFVLHTMFSDGTDIEQISFNQSHDLSPIVLTSTREIVFSRWNAYRGAGDDPVSLYKINPDGTNPVPFYGYHSQNLGTNGSEAVLIDPLEMQSGQFFSIYRDPDSAVQGGDMIFVDANNFVENTININGEPTSISAQQSASFGVAATDGSSSPQGFFNSAYPLFDGTNRILASWASCQVEGTALGRYLDLNRDLVNNNGEYIDLSGNPTTTPVRIRVPGEDPETNPDHVDAVVSNFPCSSNIADLSSLLAPTPTYGLWVFDPSDQTQSPVKIAENDTIYSEAVVLQATIDDSAYSIFAVSMTSTAPIC